MDEHVGGETDDGLTCLTVVQEACEELHGEVVQACLAVLNRCCEEIGAEFDCRLWVLVQDEFAHRLVVLAVEVDSD